MPKVMQMGVGGVLFAGGALVGLYQVLAAVNWLYIGLKAAGGIAVLGLRQIRKAPRGGL